MVRFERGENEKTIIAKSDLERAKAAHSTYNTEAVVDALMDIFHKKCYICESNEIVSIEIDHLHPHKNDPMLKYNWDNLYLSCRHCNNTKGDRYEPILDCCQIDVDKQIAFRKSGYFGVDEQLMFMPLSDEPNVVNTCLLLKDVYYGATPQKKREAKILRRNVRKELAKFKECIREYDEEEGEKKEDLRILIVRELKNTSRFTAFKRWLIRDNIERYADFKDYI